MHSYDIEASGLSELAEDSDEDSGNSGQKRTSFEDANGFPRTEPGGGAYDPPRRVQSERVSAAGQKNFDRW